MSKDIKRCPLCGGKPKLEDCGREYFIFCTKCHLEQGHLYMSKRSAIEAWNRRYGTADQISRNQVIEALDDIGHALWDVDIPSPTVPEYVEHHEQIQYLMQLVGEKIAWVSEVS